MKFVLLTDLGKKPTRNGLLFNNSRSSGSLHIVSEARAFGAEATGIDYWRSWPYELILESIVTYFNDDPEPWLALSGSIDGSSTGQFKKLVSDVKKQLPQLKVMLGGYRVPVGEKDWVDISFIGRSTNLFRKWLNKEPLDQYILSTEPLTLKNPYGAILEEPVSPIVVPEDFISSKEIIVVETALGCKFDCSFCGYDFRNTKKPHLVDEEVLYNSLKTAHDMFGVTHFFFADDTINEVDVKMELIGRVVEQLDFKPSFGAFARLDVLGAKTHQIDLIQKAGIETLFFGIESFNPNVTKLIRKGGKPDKLMDTLRLFKKELPNAFTYANFIMGLTGDSEESIWKHGKMLVDEQLVTSAGCNALRLYENLENPDVESNIDKDPGKFGYELTGQDKEWPELGYTSKTWKNDWIDVHKAEELSNEHDKFLGEGLESVFTSHEISGLSAIFGDRLPWGNYNTLVPMANRGQTIMLNKYIKNKSMFLKGK